jgi:hypothetical protein
MSLHVRAGEGNYLQIALANGGLQFKKVLNNQHTYILNVAHDPAAHAFWRIREEAGITYWDTSPDGTQWKNQAKEANPLPVGAMSVGMSAGIEKIPLVAPGRARFDNLVVGL